MNHGNVSSVIAKGLLALKERIKAAEIPSSKLDETLNIATWNIREFGKSPRTEAAIHYIAEILGQFDLIGIVELRDNLTDLDRVLKILGPTWRAVYSDMIPDAGGNRERLGFIYDKRAVTFNGLAAEANAPRAKKGLEYLPEKSFWRSPYMASFKSGSFDFVVLTTHIRWGDSDEARRQEIAMLADWIEAKRLEKTSEDKDLIVMGDFNIPSRTDALFAAITKHGLQVPKALLGAHGTNLEKDKRYDQILHYPIYPENFTNAGGELDFYISDARIKQLFPGGMTKEKFTYQISDHLPLWMQINTDIDGQKLEQIIQG
ncbi:MAG: endonuclease/exonuclease/phosphatase family protein [Verrucomicrobia bacterium]|nr:endonuclease/exonuclease/phosphatase family protein [Verrucomicrobiota bacterium]